MATTLVRAVVEDLVWLDGPRKRDLLKNIARGKMNC